MFIPFIFTKWLPKTSKQHWSKTEYHSYIKCSEHHALTPMAWASRPLILDYCLSFLADNWFLTLASLQTCGGAVILTDIVFWCIIVPFLSNSHLGLNMVRFTSYKLSMLHLWKSLNLMERLLASALFIQFLLSLLKDEFWLAFSQKCFMHLP